MNFAKRINGLTLIEILIYLALFAIIFSSIMQFTLSVAEANQTAEFKNEIERATIFVNEHLNLTFRSITQIDTNNSFFSQNDGKLKLTKLPASYTYSLTNGRLTFNNNGTSVYLTNPNVSVDQFYLERVLAPDSSIVGVRITMNIKAVKKPNLNKTIQTYYSLK
jgi:Tfp pilus assembly protein FimT